MVSDPVRPLVNLLVLANQHLMRPLTWQKPERGNAHASKEEKHSGSDNSSVTLLATVIAPLVLSAAAIVRISYGYKS